MSLNDNQSLMTNKEARLQISEMQQQMSQLSGYVASLQSQISSIPVSTTPLPNPSGAVNQLRNGSHSHSVYTWTGTGVGTDAAYEDAWWYSHPIASGQAMHENTTNSNATLVLGAVNAALDRITITGHQLFTGLACTFTGSMPAPLVAGTVYYIIALSPNIIQVAATEADAIAGVPIDLTTTTTGGNLVYNFALKNSTSTTYALTMSDWDWTTGTARFEGATDVSCPLPGNNIEPGYTYYAVGSFVKVNQYIACDRSVRLFAGLYAHSTALAGWDWVYGDNTVTATVIPGTPYTGGVSTDYLVHTVTNRDFTVNSSVVTVANGPTVTDFNNGARVLLSWAKVLNFGVNSYNVYRNTGGTYVNLFNVVHGTTYIDNNSVLAAAAGYPSADYSKLIAYTSTSAGIVDALPHQGDPLDPQWAVIPFAIKVPQNFNMGDVVIADRFWLRMGFLGVTGNFDLRMADGSITSGSPTVTTTSSGQFTAAMVGLTVDIRAIKDDSVIYTSTISGYTDANTITTAANAPTTQSPVYVYIYHAAPDHPIQMDIDHLGLVPGASYAPFSEDLTRTLPPPVVPNGTTQGGNPGGQPPGTPDGTPVCLWLEEQVTMHDGTQKRIGDLAYGDKLADGFGGWNTVHEIQDGVSDIWLVVTENGAELVASPTKQVYTSTTTKKRLSAIHIGDIILTSDGVSSIGSPVIAKNPLKDRAIVRQIGLLPKHSFLAGSKDVRVIVDNRKPVIEIL